MRTIGGLVAVLVGLASCGGQGPAPQAPDSEPSTAAFTRANAAPQESDAEITVAGEDDEQPDDAPSESPEVADGPPDSQDTVEAPESPEPETKAARPREILTAPRLAFMINYPASAPNAAAEQKCAGEHAQDFEAKAKCKQEARGEFLADVILFKKQGNTWWWYVYRRKGGTLFELSKNQVEFGEETDSTVAVKLVGKGSGQRPLFLGKREIVFTLPSESTVELDDPRYGTLVYEAKIGLVGD